MTTLRIPSFNDFSIGLLHNDLRPVLAAVLKHSKDDDAIFDELERTVLTGWDAKRIQTNIPATLRSTGLTIGRPLELSPFGQRVLAATTAEIAAQIFCTEIIKNRNGDKLIEAIQSLHLRGERATKLTLQAELSTLNVKLSNDTTDHTVLI